VSTGVIAGLFPGQGSQTNALRDEVARVVPALLNECLALVGEDPFARVSESTRFAQPAIFCASIAGWKARPPFLRPVALAGHSLGELSALVAAGALEPSAGLRLAVRRGELMAMAADGREEGMLAVLGGSEEQVAALAHEHGLVLANDNAPGQVVLAGASEQLRAASRAAREQRLRAILLDVAGAFHCPSMAAAVEPFRAELDGVEFAPPRIAVISGASGRPFEDVRAELAAAIVVPVRWRASMAALAELGADTFVDFGPGEVLAKLVPRNLPDARVLDLSKQARTAGIVGVGAALPERRVPNAELAARLGVSDEWIERRTGICERRYAAAGQRVSDLASAAARLALEDAGLAASELDMVLVATLASDEITPATAPIVAHELGIAGVAAIDVGAACAGAIAALAHATAWIESGRARTVLVIGAEILTRFVDFDDPRTAPLFADGAGAFVVAAGTTGQIGPLVLGSDGAAAEAVRATREAGVLEMEGHDTFLMAVEKLSSCTREVLELAELALEDVELFIYHQANSRILTAVSERLALPRERVFDCIAELGNTSAASIPIALGEAVRSGALRPGARVVLGAVGAGLVWGATVLTWGEASTVPASVTLGAA
jgi:3-oxoacyl-[acyl-carrier-protein] synthase-3